MPCSGRCGRRSSPCPTTSPCTRPTAPGRSARHRRARRGRRPSGTERATNPLLRIDDEDRFVATLLDGLGSFPTYFRQLPEINRRGPRLYPTLPALARLDLDTVRSHLDDGRRARRRPPHRRVRRRARRRGRSRSSTGACSPAGSAGSSPSIDPSCSSSTRTPTGPTWSASASPSATTPSLGELGHTSYVVALGTAPLVVDPARFPDRQRRIAAERGWTIAWTADTHSHADYISGSPELAADGATFLASAPASRSRIGRSTRRAVALAPGIELRAIPTPGHTPDHLAYLLVVDGEAEVLFSGGSLMVGVARPYRPARRRAPRGPRPCHVQGAAGGDPHSADDLAVYPTHGAGSFCSARRAPRWTTTIGNERDTNPLLRIDDEDRFVATLLDGLGSFPTYFRQLPEINRRGPRLYPVLPALAQLDLDTVRNHLDAGAALVDARPIVEFVAAHVPGSLSVQHRSVFASWFGWLVPLDRPVVFVLDEDTDRDDLVRQCLAVGHDNLLLQLVDRWPGPRCARLRPASPGRRGSGSSR